MESASEVPLFSQLSTVSIENYKDTIIVHLRPILEIATSYAPPNDAAINAAGVFFKKVDSSVVHISSEKQKINSSGHTLTIKQQPVEIVIEQPLDEKSLVNLLNLLGEHNPASMSQEEKGSLFSLLNENPLVVKQLNIKKTGIRIVFRIPEQTFSPLYRLPPPFDHFIGREQELKQLQARRNQDKNILQIAGTGGIGKSQLANYFARLQFREKNYNWIIWMKGGDLQTVKANLSSQFVELGLALGLPVNQLEGEPLHRLIYERLASKGRGLVIVDDAPNYKFVKPFLPENFEQREIDVLITTRNSLKFGPSISKIILDVFTLDDAKLYLRRVLKETITEADAEVLAKTLDRYPLVLTRAVTNIHDRQSAIEGDPCQYAATMKMVVELSLEQVKIICETAAVFERATRVLLAASYLAPEVAIPKALLGKWLPEDEGEIYIDEALEALRALSLVEEDRLTATYRIHKAVQDILRHDETSESTQKKLLKWNEIVESYLTLSSSKSKEYDQEIHHALETHLTVLAQNLSACESHVDDHDKSHTCSFMY
ncbi:MAG: ATP-binding protein [Gammaproteobacteria bacterium]|nr:ATP-binding protein [Gammaproteobacteria bacterium]